MNIIPDSDIILLKCPLELDNKNQITFATAEAQFTYFNSLPKIELDSASYVRKDESIRVPELLEDILEYNYLMYRNHNYSDKWIYAFITDSEYLNDNCTRIDFETDVFQTWQFDLEYKPSFVIREHTNDDTIGLNTIDEGLNIGEVVEETEVSDTSLNEYLYVGMYTDWLPSGSTTGTGDQFNGITVVNKGVNGHKLVIFKMILTSEIVPSLADLSLFISLTNSDGHISLLHDMFIIPAALINESTLESHTFTRTYGALTFECNYWTIPMSLTPASFSINVPKITSFSGITGIRNNKCYCYPYNYILATNNNGNHNIYKYELFSNTTNATFDIQLAMQIGISGRAVPTNYKGMDYNDDEAIPLGKYPTCGWTADSYVNWLTQQSVNMPFKIASTIMGLGTGSVNNKPATTANTASNIVSTANQIGSIIGDFYSAQLLPNIEGSGNTGDVLYSSGRNNIYFKCMRAKLEYLRIIDDYFTMFGYKTNLLKLPNITGRSNWNYVETQNINIIADIPQNDLNLIKEMFNNGITLWHTTTYFLDYSRTNSIV